MQDHKCPTGRGMAEWCSADRIRRSAGVEGPDKDGWCIGVYGGRGNVAFVPVQYCPLCGEKLPTDDEPLKEAVQRSRAFAEIPERLLQADGRVILAGMMPDEKHQPNLWEDGAILVLDGEDGVEYRMTTELPEAFVRRFGVYLYRKVRVTIDTIPAPRNPETTDE